MDAIMRESSFAQYIMELGREEGREESRQALREGILAVLKSHFALASSDALATRLANINDMSRLIQLHSTAAQAASLEEFEREVDRAQRGVQSQ